MKGGYIDPDNVYGVCQGLVPTQPEAPWYERLRGRVGGGGVTPHGHGLVYGALLTHLPPNMPAEAKHTIALNIELVVHGARPATLLESADYGEMDTFYAAVTTIKRLVQPYTQVAVTMRRGTHPQLLVYNQARVPPALVRAAMRSNDAMGKVLGYQCAGEQGRASYVMVRYFYSVATLPQEEELYTEMCSESEVDTQRVQRQLASYNAVARPLGVTIRVFIKQPVMSPVDLFATSMQPGGVPATTAEKAQEALVQHLGDAGLEGVAAHVQAQPASRTRWPWYATLVHVFSIHDMVVAAYGQRDGTLSRELSDLLMDTLATMTPVFKDDPSNPFMQRNITHVETVNDVLSAIAQKQYDLLNEEQDRVFYLLNQTPLSEAASYMVTPWLPAQWDALYVLMVTVLLYNMFGLGAQVGLTRNEKREKQWLEDEAGVLFS